MINLLLFAVVLLCVLVSWLISIVINGDNYYQKVTYNDIWAVFDEDKQIGWYSPEDRIFYKSSLTNNRNVFSPRVFKNVDAVFVDSKVCMHFEREHYNIQHYQGEVIMRFVVCKGGIK